MASDPGFSSDTCIFMEATTGDGGVHDADSVWWLSPDVSLNGPISGFDQADPGQVNKVRVKFRRKPADSQCIFSGSESITVEAWVANPSLVMIPSNPKSSQRIGFIGSPLPAEGGSGTQLIDWVLPASNSLQGHKCLIARAYPDSLTPSATQFFVPDDQHVVQHNLAVLVCPLTQRKPYSFRITTLNPLSPPPVFLPGIKIKAEFVPNPSDFVRKAVLRRLTSISGFEQLSTEPPPSFGFDFSGVTIAGIIPQPVGPTTTTFTSSETLITLGRAPITFQFVATLHRLVGQAYIFHVTQTSPTGVSQGGLTLVLLGL